MKFQIINLRVELISAITLFLSIPIIGNYAIHKYYEKKRLTLMKCLKGTEFKLFEKLDTEIKGILYYKKMKSDLIIYEKNIIILPYNWHFGGFIKQFQPISQCPMDNNQERINGITKIKVLENVSLSNSKLILGFKKTHLIESDIKIVFDFSGINENLKKILDENHILQNSFQRF